MAHKGEEWIARRVREASLWTKAEGEPASYSPGMSVIPAFCAVEAGGSEVQGQPGL